jgi:hypothetical protein
VNDFAILATILFCFAAIASLSIFRQRSFRSNILAGKVWPGDAATSKVRRDDDGESRDSLTARQPAALQRLAAGGGFALSDEQP